MRYLYVLCLLGECISNRMLEKGVPYSDVEAWQLHWEDQVSHAARASPPTVTRISHDMAAALRVAEYYVKKAEEEAKGT